MELKLGSPVRRSCLRDEGGVMRRGWLASLAAFGLLMSACWGGGDSGDTTAPSTVSPTTESPATTAGDAAPVVGSAWDGAVRIGVVPDYEDPFIAVAVGPDDEPIVVVNDVTTRTVRYLRCVDPACAEPAIESGIPVPDDLWLFEVGVAVDAGDAVVAMGGADLSDHDRASGLVYLVQCEGPDCATQESSRFAHERHAVLRIMPDGDWLMVTNRLVLPSPDVDEREGDNSLVVRTCDDALCRAELTLTEIPLPVGHRRPSVMFDATGAPSIVLAMGAGEPPEDGGGIATWVTCADPACGTYDVLQIPVPHEAYDFAAAAGDGPVLMYEAGEVGFIALVMDDDEPYTVWLDPVAVDDSALGAALSTGWGSLPMGLYMRMMGVGTPDEYRDIVVAECDDPVCSAGSVTVVARQGEDSYLNTNPAAALAEDGSLVIAHHDCAAGCRPMFVNVLRCEGSCAASFPDQVEARWDFPRE
jgi:hypothetical protein